MKEAFNKEMWIPCSFKQRLKFGDFDALYIAGGYYKHDRSDCKPARELNYQPFLTTEALCP